MSWMTSRFAGRCKVCGKPFNAGDRVWFRGRRLGCECRSCHGAGSTPTPPSATTPTPASSKPARKPEEPFEVPESTPLPERSRDRDPNYVPKVKAKILDRPDLVGDAYGGVAAFWRVEQTLDEFLSFINEWDKVAPQDTGSKQKGGAKWDLNCGWERSLEYLSKGWPEGTAKAKAMASKIGDIKGKMVRFETHHDVAGFAPDIGRFVAGVPDCMLAFHNQEVDVKGKNVIRVVLNMCASAYIEASWIFKRGIAVRGLVECLEAAGRSVQVEVIEATNGFSGEVRKKYAINRIIVKRAQDVMDEDRLSYILGHPAFFRRQQFRWMECLGSQSEEYGRNMSVCGSKGSPTEKCVSKHDKGDVYLGSITMDQFRDEDAMRDWIVESMKAQGVEMEK